jgi:hypothetical protein
LCHVADELTRPGTIYVSFVLGEDGTPPTAHPASTLISLRFRDLDESCSRLMLERTNSVPRQAASERPDSLRNRLFVDTGR